MHQDGKLLLQERVLKSRRKVDTELACDQIAYGWCYNGLVMGVFG